MYASIPRRKGKNQHIGKSAKGNLRHTYQISFIANRRRFRDAALVHNFVYYDREHDIALDGRTHLIVVELQKVQ
ncbi:MAG: hypothetical protein LBT68_00475, partial [Spirochaetales bacterium]|nr:hypothetical protein [Spirochaetales bacterium]